MAETRASIIFAAYNVDTHAIDELEPSIMSVKSYSLNISGGFDKEHKLTMIKNSPDPKRE